MDVSGYLYRPSERLCALNIGVYKFSRNLGSIWNFVPQKGGVKEGPCCESVDIRHYSRKFRHYDAALASGVCVPLI